MITAKSEKQDLELKFERTKKEIHALKEINQEKEDDINKLKQKFKDIDNKMDSLRDTIKEKEDIIFNLERSVENHKRKFNNTTHELEKTIEVLTEEKKFPKTRSKTH